MASRRARKQPPAFQGISCAPAWSGGAEHISLPALIPPRMGRDGKASSAYVHGSQSPSLSPCCPPARSIPGGAQSHPVAPACSPANPSRLPASTRLCIPAPKQQLFPPTVFFFCTPSGSRCNLPPY